jgi:acetoin utilization deacetylase AcuC-like enzyme
MRASPNALTVFYSTDMVADSGRPRSPSDQKPLIVAQALKRTPWPIELVAPEPCTLADICSVHDPEFVVGVLEQRRPSGFGSTSPSVARSLPYTCGACYDSCVAALRDGISASLTSGFHHAGPSTARGFCTFNGLMIAASQLLRGRRADKIAIIDCDYHYGDGTQAIIDAQGLSDRVLHVSFGRTFKRREQAEAYIEGVYQLRSSLREFAPDVLIYQAGADAHVDDPLGGLLTTEQMRERDRVVFAVARELGIAVAWNLAGGYQIDPDGSIPRVVELHLNTFEEALRVWQLLA